jgi:hypothetical protein
MEQQSKIRPLALVMTILSGLARLLPHPPNFTPVGSMSLFAGARLNGWMAYLVPLAIMLVSDPLVGMVFGTKGYTRSSVFVYGSFLISVWIGRQLRKSENWMKIGAAAFLCSLQFYLITNFGLWAIGGGRFYPQTMAGLADCYIAALPFWGRTLAGDLTFTAVMFGLYAWLSRRVAPAERTSLQTV